MKNAIIVCILGALVNLLNAQSVDYTEAVFTGGIEGPAYKDSLLYVVNYKEEGTIGVVDSRGEVSQLVKLEGGSIGNSLQFTNAGTLLIADYVNHNVLEYHPNEDRVSIYAHSELMNQPNDIVISDKGIVYASDPNWGDGTGNLWMINQKREVVLLEDSMGTTNGITISPDGRYLYVNESVQRKIWRYIIQEDGSLTDKRLLTQFTDFGLDGMKCDKHGVLYVTRYGKGVVAIVSTRGVLLNELNLQGAKPTNLVFNTDQSVLYVTMQERKCVEKISLR